MGEDPRLYEIAKQVTLEHGLPYTDPRTGRTTQPSKTKTRPKTTRLEIVAHVPGCVCDGEEGEWDIRCVAAIPEVHDLIFSCQKKLLRRRKRHA